MEHGKEEEREQLSMEIGGEKKRGGGGNDLLSFFISLFMRKWKDGNRGA